MVQIRRVYDSPAPSDGRRVLVDRLWPRGLNRDRARIDEWAKELAPSDALRRWFGHDPERFREFEKRYRGELAAQRARLQALAREGRRARLTLVYGARDERHNNAVVLKKLLSA